MLHYLITLIVIMGGILYPRQAIANHSTLASYEFLPLSGIPQSEINCIMQDDLGFIWFGTLDGLHRFDGYNYKSYVLDLNDSTSIASNMILKLAQDRMGNIWIGTYGRGLCKLDPKTGKFTNYKLSTLFNSELPMNDIPAMMIDSKNQIWIGNTFGIFKLSLNDAGEIEQPRYYPYNKEYSINRNIITDFYEDTRGQIWFGHNGSVERLISEKGNTLEREIFNVICNDITGDEKGLLIGGDKIMRIDYNPQLQRYEQPYTISDNPANCINIRDGKIWIGSRRGVKILKKNEENKWLIDLNINKSNLPFQSSSNVITAITISRDNRVWIGTRGARGFSIKEKTKRFYNYPSSYKQLQRNLRLTRTIFEDSHQNLWLGDEEKGVYLLPKGKNYDSNLINIKINNEYNDRAYAFEETVHPKKNVIWIGTCYPKCLQAIDAQTHQFIPEISPGMNDIGFVFSLKKTDEHTLWAGTYNHGLWRLRLNNKGQVISKDQYLSSNSSLSSNIIRSLYVDQKGALWIGTDIGINRLQPEQFTHSTPVFSHILSTEFPAKLSDYYVLQITESKRGEILIGTMGNGLLVFDPIKNTLNTVTTQNGLGNNCVKTILCDPNSEEVWLATNHGISRCELEHRQITTYFEENGLVEEEFSEICGVVRQDSTLIFGSRKGLVKFKPNEILKNNTSPALFLSQIYIQNKPVTLDQTPEFLKELILDYEQHNFSLEFVGLDFDAPRSIQYQYMLEGFDTDWTNTKADFRRATYTNLPEGNYVFKLRVTNGDGIRSSEELTLPITIHPPFYRSLWAYIGYFMLMLLALLLTYYIINAFARSRHRIFALKLEHQKEEEINQYRFQFFTNISHDFRTPLTLINIAIDSLFKQSNFHEDAHVHENMKILRSNASRLGHLIDEFLEFRKIEQGKEVMQLCTIHIAPYLVSFLEQFKPLADRQLIEFTFEQPQEEIAVEIDLKQFEKVVFNILSNAFKYTPEGGKIHLGLKTEGNDCIIWVQDNGNGIDQEALPHIFDRYFQTGEQRYIQQGSSGIGLALCKSIMLQLKGDIWMESKPGEGTCCSLKLKVTTKYEALQQVATVDLQSNMEQFLANQHFQRKEDTPVQAPINYLKMSEEQPKEFRILVVEDHEVLRNQIVQHLQAEYEVVEACNGQEGLQKCLETYPSLIVSDLKMPLMDGIQMCNKIKAKEEISHIPVIILTANHTLQNQIDSYELAQADAYLKKPFNIDVLKSLIKSTLRNRTLIHEKYRNSMVINPEELTTTPTDKKFLLEIIHIIKSHMNNPELNVEFIAQKYGVSRIYLNRKIKALTGETSIQFLRNIRLQYAATLLEQGKLNINEIAWEVGYSDVNTFRSRFKEKYGTTPKAYSQLEQK